MLSPTAGYLLIRLKLNGPRPPLKHICDFGHVINGGSPIKLKE